MLHTLPKREFRAGMAEVIKSAILRDRELFELLERCDADLQSGRLDVLYNVVLAAASVKNVVLAENEIEPGKRTLLNLGHTIAHAIEKLTHQVNHGEAVAIGLSMMAWASVRQGRMSCEEAQRIDALLKKFGFNLELPMDIFDILREARYDKKKMGDKIDVVMPLAVGDCVVEQIAFKEFESMFV
jgi:3-dehydroquinate synthase